jgi:transcriptional regulator with XRE-family HTH domain
MAYAIVACMAEPVGGRLSAALKATYLAAGVSQVQIADRLGVEQPAVSKWARGMRRVPIDILPPIEELCGVPKGTILRRAGYVDDQPTEDLETAIRSHPRLDARVKQIMLTIYRDSVRNDDASDIALHIVPNVDSQPSS